MNAYEDPFFGMKLAGQILLSSDDFSSAVRYQKLYGGKFGSGSEIGIGTQ